MDEKNRAIASRYFAQRNASEDASGVRLHLGCGGNALPGWLNTDYYPRLPEVMHLDATARLPFQDATFDYVFSEHMIEHIPYAAGLFMLSECRRVLKPSGTLRISTPDLAFLIDLARPDKSELQRAYIQWAARTFTPGAPDDNAAFVINNFVRDWGHLFIYDEPTLRAAMLRVGFTKVARCDLQQSEHAALRDLENETRMPPGFLRLESFTLEGEG